MAVLATVGDSTIDIARGSIVSKVSTARDLPRSAAPLACRGGSAASGSWSCASIAEECAVCSCSAAAVASRWRQAPGWAFVAATVMVCNRRLVQRSAQPKNGLRLYKPPKNMRFPKMKWGKDSMVDEERIQEAYEEARQARREATSGVLTTQTFKRIEPAVRSFYYSQCPPENPKLPEIAVFGISNVGKSSFINFLCNRKLLSTVSKHPGHTRLIHHFLIDKSWYLVDLPGIGHAEAPGKTLKSMDKMIASYVRHRATLIQVLYLVDASQPPLDLDLDAIKWLTESDTSLTIVFTKTDIRTKRTPPNPVEAMNKALTDMEGSPFRFGVKDVPPMFLTSSEIRTGREPVLDFLMDLRAQATPKSLKKKQQKEFLVPPGAAELDMVVGDKKGRRNAIKERLVPTGIR